jgi:hypothetical protein
VLEVQQHPPAVGGDLDDAVQGQRHVDGQEQHQATHQHQPAGHAEHTGNGGGDQHHPEDRGGGEGAHDG